MPRRKESINVNLVFEDDAYRVVGTVEFHRLLGRKEIIFEKAREDKGIIGHFYNRVNSVNTF